jgi:hypothetical protein
VQAQEPQPRQPVGQPASVHFPLPPGAVPKSILAVLLVQFEEPPQPPAELQTQAPHPLQPVGQAPSLQAPLASLVPLPPGLTAIVQFMEPLQPPVPESQAQEPQFLHPGGQPVAVHLLKESTLAALRQFPPPQLVAGSVQPQPAPQPVPPVAGQPQDIQVAALLQARTPLEGAVVRVGS